MFAVPLTAGEHVVVFDYEPAGFKMGIMISAASILILLIMAFWSLRKPKTVGKHEKEVVQQRAAIPEDELDEVITIDDLPKE